MKWLPILRVGDGSLENDNLKLMLLLILLRFMFLHDF